MAKKSKSRQRPFNSGTLKDFASGDLYPKIGAGAAVSRFTVIVPVEQVRPFRKPKASAADLAELEQMLVRHFGGVTIPPASTGFGLRNPTRLHEEPEMNYNVFFVVYAAPVRESDVYFQTLQTELQLALDEGVILIEK